MPNDQGLTIYFHRTDGQCEQIPLVDGTISETASAIQRVFYISDGHYTKAEIYRGKELIEIVENPACVHVESILVQ